MKKNPTRKFKLADLKPHPLQQQLFGDLPEGKLDALVEDIERNGLRHPIEVLPDGTLIKGHQRVQAFERLGREEIDAIVRSDLAEKGELAIKEEMLADNAHRKQLSRLDEVRVHLALIETRAEQNTQSNGFRQPVDVRGQIAAILDISDRNVGRYLSALKAPKEVQEAFEADEIKLTEAEKVGALPDEKKQDIARRIRGGESACQVVRETVKKSKKSTPKLATILKLLAQALDAATAVFPDRLEDLSRYTAKPQNTALFGKGAKMLQKLRDWNVDALKGLETERSLRDCDNNPENQDQGERHK